MSRVALTVAVVVCALGWVRSERLRSVERRGSDESVRLLAAEVAWLQAAAERDHWELQIEQYRPGYLASLKDGGGRRAAREWQSEEARRAFADGAVEHLEYLHEKYWNAWMTSRVALASLDRVQGGR